MSLLPAITFAQSALSLTVSPTLFEMSANPGQEWSSSIRVVNSNSYPITIFANAVNFAPQGEDGQGKFVPIIEEESKGQTIAEWISIPESEIIIPPEQTHKLDFTIKVPEDASPGGHFAAVLIGTKPPANETGVPEVKTSQIVTSLVFLRVTGDVVESGNIRSFRTTSAILEKPEATFELRFENKGNVHIQPQGDIKILNMWGQERGVIPINRSTMFGNVLPESIRMFTFTWTGKWSMADIGRYTAIATIGYGDKERQFVNSETAFWVIPWKIMGAVILVLLGFAYLFTWAVKLYIRKMLNLAGLNSSQQFSGKMISNNQKARLSVVAPIEAGMLDLRGRLQHTTTNTDRLKTVAGFVSNYKFFFLALLGAILFISAVVWYVKSASTPERPYEVTFEGVGEGVKITSEDTAYQKLVQGEKEKVATNPELPQIKIVNRSGINGLAASLRIYLENMGYEIVSMSNDLETKENNTIIVFEPGLEDQALTLSNILEGALLSSYSGLSESKAQISIYVGKDIVNIVQ